MRESIRSFKFSSRNFLELSWIFIFLFILIERLGILLEFYDSLPKSLLLNLKYSAVLLCLFAVFTRNRCKATKLQTYLLASLSMILLISLLNINNYGSVANFQEAISWLYVFMNALLVGTDYQLLVRLLLYANSFSLFSIFLGEKAWSKDDRLQFLDLPGRLTGLFGQPNVTALCAAFTILCLNRKHRKHFGFHLLIATIVLLLTASLTVIFGILFAMLVVLSYRYIGKTVALLSSFSILVFSVVYPFTLRESEVNFLTANQFTGRVAIWGWTKNVITTPGFKPNLNLFNEHLSSLSSHIPWFHAHNQFLMNWATGGLVMATFGVTLPLILIVLAFNQDERLKTGVAAIIILVVNLSFEVPLFLDKLDARTLLLVLVIHKVSEGTKTKGLRL